MRIRPVLENARERMVFTGLSIAMLLGTPLVMVWPVVALGLSAGWPLIGLSFAVSVAIGLVVGAVYRRNARYADAVNGGVYAHVFLVLALLNVARGGLVLLTGQRASKIASFPTSRASSLLEFGLAAAFGALAVACQVYDERARGPG